MGSGSPGAVTKEIMVAGEERSREVVEAIQLRGIDGNQQIDFCR